TSRASSRARCRSPISSSRTPSPPPVLDGNSGKGQALSMQVAIKEQFRDELLRDEQVLWVGQPDPRVLFVGADILLIPFSIMFCGFALFWEAGVLASTGRQGAPPTFFA